jgi:hypothetical protein
MLSSCLMHSGSATVPLYFPVGNPGDGDFSKFRPRVEVITFSDSTCNTPVNYYYFPSGVANASGAAGTMSGKLQGGPIADLSDHAKWVAGSSTSRLFLRRKY